MANIGRFYQNKDYKTLKITKEKIIEKRFSWSGVFFSIGICFLIILVFSFMLNLFYVNLIKSKENPSREFISIRVN